MAKRINVMLPESTISTINRLAKPGERSRFIDKAVQHYAATRGTDALREQLKQSAIRDRDLDTAEAEDWAAVDSESWQRLDPDDQKQPHGRSAAKSTSRRSTRR